MRAWFWAWLVVALAIGIVSALTRDRASSPFAAGALAAAALEALHGSPVWEWTAFLGVSAVLFLAVNSAWYRRRHGSRGLGRHAARAEAEAETDAETETERP